MTYPENMTQGLVLVVAAQPELAGKEYDRYGVYICPANEDFKKNRFWDCSHIAFYMCSEDEEPGYIAPGIPKILMRVESVCLTPEGIDEVPDEELQYQDRGLIREQLRSLVSHLEQSGDPDRRLGSPHQVFFLSAPDAIETVRLPAPIINNTVDWKGDPVAFTAKFRYVPLWRFYDAKGTADLEGD